MSVAKAKRLANPLVAGIAAISVTAAVINPTPPPQPPALARVVQAPVSLAGLGDPIAGAGLLASDALYRLGGIASGLLGPSLLHLPNVIAEQPGAVTAYFLRGVINGLSEEVAGILNGQQDIPGGVAGILSAISYNAQQLAAVEAGIFGDSGLLGAAASPQQVSAKAESVQADAAALPALPNLGIGQLVGAAGSLTGFLLSGVGGILTPLLGIDLHIPGVISDQPYAITQYFLRGIIDAVTGEIGGVIDGQQDIPGALAAIVDSISSNAQQLATIESSIFGQSGLLGAAAASPQQVSAKAESVQADAAALPALPNLGIGQLVGAAGSLTGFLLSGVGGILTPLLGIDLHIPGVISDQPYAITQYFLRGIIDAVTGEIGGVIDGQQDIPGALAAIVDSISSNAQQLATIESSIFGQSGLLGAAASPQQVSAKAESVQADAAALPGLPNLGIGSAIAGVGITASAGVAEIGSLATSLLGPGLLHLPAIISGQPYVLTNLIIEQIGVAGFSSLGGLIDGTLDIPGAVTNILGALTQANANTAIAEGRLLGGGLQPTLASPQQVSAKSLSIAAPEAKTPDPVSAGTNTPEVKSLGSKTTDESTPASTRSAPDSTGTPTTADKGTPAADKGTTPADPTSTSDKDKTGTSDKDKTGSADKDKTGSADKDKTGSADKDKDKTGSTDKDKDKTGSADKDKSSTGDKDKSSSSDHDKG